MSSPAYPWARRRFDSIAHRYYLDDVEVVGVTRALSLAGLDSQARRFYTQAGRERGRAVHQLSAESDPIPEIEYLGYLEAARVCELQIYGDAPPNLCVEEPLYDETDRYAGTPDRFGIDLAGDHVLLDFKTGAVDRSVALQLAAYARLAARRYALRETAIQRVAACLRADGTFRLTEFRDRRDFAVWGGAVLVAQWKMVA